MRRFWVSTLLVVLAISFSSGQQQTGPPTQSSTADEQPVRVKVYAAGHGVTAPELLPLTMRPFSAEKCNKTVDGTVELSLLVDATGQPRNLMFLHPLGNDLDLLALRIVGEDRFSPGTLNGTPVAVGQSVELTMNACVKDTEDNEGDKEHQLRLQSQPEQKFRSLPHPPNEAVLISGALSLQGTSGSTSRTEKLRASSPVLLNTVDPKYTPEARKAMINGVCTISLIVDTQGIPQNAQVIRALDPGLDQNAIDTAYQYRFKPAMKSGEPVPVRITVDVKFAIW